jgi:hypothetical protein
MTSPRQYGTAEGNMRWAVVFGVVVGLLTFLTLTFGG